MLLMYSKFVNLQAATACCLEHYSSATYDYILYVRTPSLYNSNAHKISINYGTIFAERFGLSTTELLDCRPSFLYAVLEIHGPHSTSTPVLMAMYSQGLDNLLNITYRLNKKYHLVVY